MEGLVNEWTALGWSAQIASVLSDKEYRKPSQGIGRFKKRWQLYIDAALLCRSVARRRSEVGGICVATTNPFFAPALIHKRAQSRCKTINWLFDLYPEVLISSGVIKERRTIAGNIARITRYSLRECAATVFLGERLRHYTETRYGKARNGVVIPIGGNGEVFKAHSGHMERKASRVVMSYIGLMGNMHDWETAAMTFELGIPPEMLVRFHSAGASYDRIRGRIGEDRASLEFNQALGHAAWIDAMIGTDVALVTLARGAGNIVMPSKVYSAMLAGQAILAVTEESSDLADIINRYDCGWTVKQGDHLALARLMRHICQNRDELAVKRMNSRRAGFENFDVKIVSKQWHHLFCALEDERRQEASRCKVLYFHQHFAMRSGAGGTRSYEIGNALVKSGKDVTIVTGKYEHSGLPKEGREITIGAGLRVIVRGIAYSNANTFGQRLVKFARYALEATWVMLRNRADVIYATSTPLSAGLPALVAKLLGRKVTFIFEERDRWPAAAIDVGVLRNRLLIAMAKWLEKYLYKKADALVGLSPGVVRAMRDESQSEKPIIFVPNGSDVGHFGKRKRHGIVLPGVPAEGFWAVYIGAHGVANDLGYMLDGARKLKLLGRSDVHFIVVGDGKEKVSLRNRALKEGLTNCHFMEPMDKGRIAELLSAADAGLVLMRDVPEFRYGTSPNKFFDYIAAGLPVVVNWPGWLADLIAANGCGVISAPGDGEALGVELAFLADSPRWKLEEMGKNGRALAEREFSREILNQRVIELIDDLQMGVAGGDAEMDPENWTGGIVKSKPKRERSTCPRNDVSIIPN